MSRDLEEHELSASI